MAFLPLVLAGFWLPGPWALRKAFLMAASYLFYGAFQPEYVLLLMTVTAVDYQIGRLLAESGSAQGRRLLMAASIALNIGFLAFFKYTNFFLAGLNDVLHLFGMQGLAGPLAIALPAGISFFTFQSLSYTIDIYRRQIRPADSILDFAFFVSFFPHLVAGPIVRASEFLWQCRAPYVPSAQELQRAVILILGGMFQKIVLADQVFGPPADAYFNSKEPVSFADAWMGVLSFSGQIYCDFNGYTMCAIGVALLFGFRLPQNFNYPYAAIGFSDFWSRWHMSLSRWIRDYLYIGLGGNRLGTSRTLANLMVTMALVGLWHGAAWTFVAWGLFHGVYLAVERAIFGKLAVSRDAVGLPKSVGIGIVTFILATIAWVPFRSNSIHEVWPHLSRLFPRPSSSLVPLVINHYAAALALGALVLLVASQHLGRRNPLIDRLDAVAWPYRGIAYCLLAMSLLFFAGEQRRFIYFQF